MIIFSYTTDTTKMYKGKLKINLENLTLNEAKNNFIL